MAIDEESDSVDAAGYRLGLHGKHSAGWAFRAFPSWPENTYDGEGSSRCWLYERDSGNLAGYWPGGDFV